MNIIRKRGFAPGVFFIFIFFLVAVSCASGSGKGDQTVTGTGKDSGSLDPKGPLARESFDCLKTWLADKRPEIVPLVVDSAWIADKKGSEVVIVCSYREKGKDLWLKAVLVRDSRGKQRVTKVLFAWEYDKRLEE